MTEITKEEFTQKAEAALVGQSVVAALILLVAKNGQESEEKISAHAKEEAKKLADLIYGE